MARGDVGDDRGTAADAVAVAVVGVVERQQHFVGNRFDEAGAKQRNWHAPRDHIRLRWDDRLTGVGRNREGLKQRARLRYKLHELAAFVSARRPDFRHDARAPDRRHAVADRAARAVERRTEAVFDRLDLREIAETQAELLEFSAGDPRQRISRQRTDGLPRELDPDQREVHAGCQSDQTFHLRRSCSSTPRR